MANNIIERKKCYRFGCNEKAVGLYSDKFSTCYLNPVCELHQFTSTQNVPYPENFTPHTEQEWSEAIIGEFLKYKFCSQCSHMVQEQDFDPRAGMCGACINEAMAEAGDYFSKRGLVASIEEEAHND